MDAELKRLHSPDIYDLENYKPENPEEFGFLLQAMIGPEGKDGEESFDIEVCTPKWLEKTYGINDVIVGRHHFIVREYNYQLKGTLPFNCVVNYCKLSCMPRLARSVFAEIPHHITQRGNRREDVFFTDDDCLIYLEWLKLYCEKYDVFVLAYCLMTNHVHLVLTPQRGDGLQKVLKPLHMRYSQHINKVKGWKGHLWQGRFFSSPLDDEYTWSTIRYVERNPVQAGMVIKAEDYQWSSAAAHCGLKEDPLLATLPRSMSGVSQESWSEWLALAETQSVTDIIQRNIEKGLPCGNDCFIDKLEVVAKRSLRYKAQGRPFKMNKG